MQTQGLIFDLDGTLLDTLEDLTHAVNHVLSHLGQHPITTSTCRRMIGNGARVLLERAAGGGAQDVQAALDRFLAYYDKHKLDHTQPYAGVPETLDALTEQGQRYAVLSNKPHAATVEMVDRLLPTWTFEAVLGQREHVPLKPDPKAALEICQRMHIQPADLVFVGDSGEDMETAKAAGMFAVGVTWGMRDEAELRERGADAIIHTPAELINALP